MFSLKPSAYFLPRLVDLVHDLDDDAQPRGRPRLLQQSLDRRHAVEQHPLAGPRHVRNSRRSIGLYFEQYGG